MNSGWSAVLHEVFDICNCGVMEWNLNWNNQTKNYFYSCISQGVRSTATMYTVDNGQMNRFAAAYNKYLSVYPNLLVNTTDQSFSITFTNGTEISISKNI